MKSKIGNLIISGAHQELGQNIDRYGPDLIVSACSTEQTQKFLPQCPANAQHHQSRVFCDAARKGQELSKKEYVDYVMAAVAETAGLAASYLAAGQTVLMHCRVGKDRSASVALATLVHMGWSVNQSLCHMYRIRPQSAYRGGALGCVQEYCRRINVDENVFAWRERQINVMSLVARLSDMMLSNVAPDYNRALDYLRVANENQDLQAGNGPRSIQSDSGCPIMQAEADAKKLCGQTLRAMSHVHLKRKQRSLAFSEMRMVP